MGSTEKNTWGGREGWRAAAFKLNKEERVLSPWMWSGGQTWVPKEKRLRQTLKTQRIHTHTSVKIQQKHSQILRNRLSDTRRPQIDATIDVTRGDIPMTYYSEDVKNTKQRNNVKSCKGKCHLTYKGRISIAPAALNIRKPQKTRIPSIQALWVRLSCWLGTHHID